MIWTSTCWPHYLCIVRKFRTGKENIELAPTLRTELGLKAYEVKLSFSLTSVQYMDVNNPWECPLLFCFGSYVCMYECVSLPNPLSLVCLLDNQDKACKERASSDGGEEREWWRGGGGLFLWPPWGVPPITLLPPPQPVPFGGGHEGRHRSASPH